MSAVLQPPSERESEKANYKHDQLRRQHQIRKRTHLKAMLRIVDEKGDWPAEIPNEIRWIRARVSKVGRRVTWQKVDREANQDERDPGRP